MAWLLNWLWLLCVALGLKGCSRPWERGRLARKAALEARLTLTLALSHKGRGDLSLAVERGRLARRAALEARLTLTLALSHEGRGDPLSGICT